MIRVEVLDSSSVFLCGLAQMLPRDGIEIVGMRCTPHEAFSFEADVYLMDTCTLHALGEQACNYVLKAARRCVVLLLTPARDFPVADYLEAGAVDVISKQEDVNTLVQVIRSVVRPEVINVPPQGIEAARAGAPLSGREMQVLGYIASGYTHSQAATRLGISQHTVDTYVKRIRAKLAVGNKAELTRAAIIGSYLQWPAQLLGYWLRVICVWPHLQTSVQWVADGVSFGLRSPSQAYSVWPFQGALGGWSDALHC